MDVSKGVVLCMKKLHFISRNWRKENSTVACGFSPIKIQYSVYPKRINEVNVFSIKYRYRDILLKSPKLCL